MKISNENTPPVVSGRRRFARNVTIAGALAVSAVIGRIGKASANGGRGGGGRGGGGGGGGPSCFLAGTRILTPEGQVEISQLRAGDLVVTRSGAAKPVVRVESSTFSRQANAHWSRDVLPVTIQAGALGPATPHTDLRISQLHTLLLDGVLVPAGDLVNGTTIAVADCEHLASLDYYHLELQDHDVVVAEGAACETKLNMDPALPSSVPCAPVYRNAGALGGIASRLRSAVSPIIDRRRRLDIIRDRLDDRVVLRRAA